MAFPFKSRNSPSVGPHRPAFPSSSSSFTIFIIKKKKKKKKHSSILNSDIVMAAEAHHQFHVLAVDDSIIDRKLIETLLKTSSFQVTAVDSGNKALEFLGLDEDEQNHHNLGVNMIITDYSMPGMTGYDLLRKIKKSKHLKDVPVVIMSSENIPSRINRCLEEGAEEFILKPVQLSDMNKLKPHLFKGRSRKDQDNSNKRQASMKENQSPNKARRTPLGLEVI